MKTIDLSPRFNIPTAEQELALPAGTQTIGQQYGGLSMFSSVFKRGYGDNVFGSDSNGIWLGKADYGAAPFRVGMDGAVTATNLTASGYLVTGSAAADVNAGATTISGGKITAASITATQIAANTITAAKIATGTITATQIASGTITADRLNVSSLSAISANIGTITSGSITGVSITSSGGNNKIVLNNGDYLEFYNAGVRKGKIRAGSNSGMIAEEGSFVTKINEGFFACVDTSYTDFFQLYANTNGGILSAPSVNRIYLTKSDGTTLLSTSDTQTYSLRRFNTDADNIGIGGKTLALHRSIDFSGENPGFGDSQNIAMESSAKIVIKNGWQFAVGDNKLYIANGGSYTEKAAILETSQGYRSVLCPESPEVWFFDFYNPEFESPDPLFMEITEGDVHEIKCTDGYVQIWRRRKGYAHKRFEQKTEEQYRRSVEFWTSLNKPEQLKKA